MSTDVPLLNDYKKSFVRKRFLQTFLAGLRIPGCPWYAVIMQIGVFLSPVTGIAPFLVIVSTEETDSGSALQDLILVLCLGAFIFFWAVTVQSLAFLLNYLSSRPITNEVSEIRYNVESRNDSILTGIIIYL